MGCDIHVHIEIRCNNKWEHYACPSVARWYDLFGIMAGVRVGVEPIVEPKGVPDDMSIITNLDWQEWVDDAHHASWFNEEEIDKLVEWLAIKEKEAFDIEKEYQSYGRYDLEHGILKGTYLFGNSLTAFKHYSDTDYIPKCCDAVRIVFWFDN